MPTVVLLTKLVRPGQVKTRLSRDIGREWAERFQRALLTDTLTLLRVLERRHGWGIVFMWADPSGLGLSAEDRAEIPPDWEVVPQLGGNLGRRIQQALDYREGLSLVLGSDAPQMSEERLEEAMLALNNGDARVVLGPVEDGGFDLIGSNSGAFEGLEEVAWSTPQTLEQTEEKARESGCQVLRLKESYDLDEARDLPRLLELPPTKEVRGVFERWSASLSG